MKTDCYDTSKARYELAYTFGMVQFNVLLDGNKRVTCIKSVHSQTDDQKIVDTIPSKAKLVHVMEYKALPGSDSFQWKSLSNDIEKDILNQNVPRKIKKK